MLALIIGLGKEGQRGQAGNFERGDGVVADVVVSQAWIVGHQAGGRPLVAGLGVERHRVLLRSLLDLYGGDSVVAHGAAGEVGGGGGEDLADPFKVVVLIESDHQVAVYRDR